MFNKRTILITGGTGSFGQKFTKYLLKKYKPKKIKLLWLLGQEKALEKHVL